MALSAFLGDIFFSDVGIILLKTLIFTNLVFALVLVHGPAVFESEFDWKLVVLKVYGFQTESYEYECLLIGNRLIWWKVYKGQKFVLAEIGSPNRMSDYTLKTFGNVFKLCAFSKLRRKFFRN